MKNVVNRNLNPDKRILLETLAVILVTAVLFMVFYDQRSIVTILPAAYFIIERGVRGRSWSEIGFKFSQIADGIKKSWIWIALVAVGSQLLTLTVAKLLVPEYVEHVVSRLPMNVNDTVAVVIALLIGTFLEEIIFRGFLQERLSWFISTVCAIALSSCLFALMHIAAGSFGVVAIDMAGIVIDSILFGIIYAKTKNIYVSWIAHCLADFVGLGLIKIFF